VSNQEYPPFGKPEGSTSLAIKIGLAIFLAILATSAIRWLYANWVMQQVLETVNQFIAQSQVQLATILLMEQQRRDQLKVLRLVPPPFKKSILGVKTTNQWQFFDGVAPSFNPALFEHTLAFQGHHEAALVKNRRI